MVWFKNVDFAESPIELQASQGRNRPETSSAYSIGMQTQQPTRETWMISTTSSRPNFPPCPHDAFTLEWIQESSHSAFQSAAFPPLRSRSGSGLALPVGGLVCRPTETEGVLAGGCAVVFPRQDDTPSPRHLPHPVLGEWISALRYTGCSWIETGVFAVNPGFSEEQVLDALWSGLERLMKRNGVNFLVGAAPQASLALDRAQRQGARALEPAAPGALRYFVYAV
jgi:hypothetical protein